MGSYVTTTGISPFMVGTVFGTTVTALATACIARAENEANKYVSNRYSVVSWTTTASTPPLICSLVSDLSIGYTYEALARGSKDAYIRADRYIKRAIKNLEDIRDYKVSLLDTSGSAITELSNPSQRVQCNSSGYSDTFNEDDPLDWKADSDKLTDIANGRE